MATKGPAPCITEGCSQPKALPRHRCQECYESSLPMVTQVKLAEARREEALRVNGQERKRVSEKEWPEGRRWCAGCQSFRRLGFEVSGSASRCRPCASAASHRSRTKATFGLEPEEYERLLEFQGGLCALCLQRPVSKRLAVDHDHRTGDVRGLLCSRCNHEALGALHDSLEFTLRVVRYLALPPAREALRSDLGPCESCQDQPATAITVELDESEKDPQPFAVCQGCSP